MFRTFFSWFWMLLNLGVLWFLLLKVRNSIPKALLTICLMLNVAAGLCNGLVMTANGCRMPVEEIENWDDAPKFFEKPGVFQGWAKRGLGAFDPKERSDGSDGVHWSVPTSGPASRSVHFAFLDDRHPFIVAGTHQTFSVGDILFMLGAFLGLLAIPCLMLGFLWKLAFRKK